MDGGLGNESNDLMTKSLVREVPGIITVVMDCYGGYQNADRHYFIKRWPGTRGSCKGLGL